MISAEFLTRLRVQAWDAEQLGHWHIANTLRETVRVLSTRHQLVSDNDGHDYVIPVSQSAAWDEFLAIPSDDERSWNTPGFARRVEGGLTFIDPQG